MRESLVLLHERKSRSVAREKVSFCCTRESLVLLHERKSRSVAREKVSFCCTRESLVLLHERKSRSVAREKVSFCCTRQDKHRPACMAGQSDQCLWIVYYKQNFSIFTFSPLMSSANNLCKQFGLRPGPTKCWASSGSKVFDTQTAYL